MRCTIPLLLSASAALAGPVARPWNVNGPDDTAGVAAAALSGWYATADSYEDNIEIRDVNQTLMRTVSREEIVALLPWMDLNGSADGVGALAFSDSGRLLFIEVHDAASAPDGQGSDAILRYDTQINELRVFARLDLAGADSPWPHAAIAHFKGRLYVGTGGQVRVYRAERNDLSGSLLGTTAVVPGAMVTGLAVDRSQGALYAGCNDTVYRSPAGTSLSFTPVGAIPNLRALAWSDCYGGPSQGGLYALDATTSPAAGRVWFITPAMARGQAGYAPSLYDSTSTDCHDLAATADGGLLLGAEEDAILLTDDTDTRLSFQAFLRDEFAQSVSMARSLVTPTLAPVGTPPGWVIDADTVAGQARFHPASPDAAAWTVLALLMNDHLNNDPTALPMVRLILQRYAGLGPDHIVPLRSADGIYWHWINPMTGGDAGWGDGYSTMSTMKIVLAASRAAAFYPNDGSVQQSARAIVCGIQNWDSYFNPTNSNMYLLAQPGGGPDFGSASGAFHEGILFADEAGVFGATSGPLAKTRWYERWRWPVAMFVSGRPISSSFNGYQPAFVSLYPLLLLRDYRNSTDWRTQVLNLRLSSAAWTDDNGPPFFTVFSAGTTRSDWGGYHADTLGDHPGDVATFTSLEAFCAGLGNGPGSTAEGVAAYNAYRRGARETFLSGASILYRRSGVDPSYTPDSAGLPDATLGALGLAELISPGSVQQVLTGPYVSCGTFCVADFNRSGGTPDDADIAAFFFAWNNGDNSADVNASGGTPDDADISFFFQHWGDGC